MARLFWQTKGRILTQQRRQETPKGFVFAFSQTLWVHMEMAWKQRMFARSGGHDSKLGNERVRPGVGDVSGSEKARVHYCFGAKANLFWENNAPHITVFTENAPC